MDYKDLGFRIRQQRVEKDWTQEQLAAAIGMSTSFVGHIERGTRKASLETLVLLANALGASLDYLLAGSLSHGLEEIQPEKLSAGQKLILRDMMGALYDRMVYWTKDEDTDESEESEG